MVLWCNRRRCAAGLRTSCQGTAPLGWWACCAHWRVLHELEWPRYCSFLRVDEVVSSTFRAIKIILVWSVLVLIEKSAAFGTELLYVVGKTSSSNIGTRTRWNLLGVGGASDITMCRCYATCGRQLRANEFNGFAGCYDSLTIRKYPHWWNRRPNSSTQIRLGTTTSKKVKPLWMTHFYCHRSQILLDVRGERSLMRAWKQGRFSPRFWRTTLGLVLNYERGCHFARDLKRLWQTDYS